MKQFEIQENDSGQRLDRFLQKVLPALPKGAVYKAIRTKHIKINKKRCTPDQRLMPGDMVTLFLPDTLLYPESAPVPKSEPEFLQAPDQLDILFENEQLLLVSKPVGLWYTATTDRHQIR